MKKLFAVFCILLGLCLLTEGILPAGGQVSALAEKEVNKVKTTTEANRAGKVKKHRLEEKKGDLPLDWDDEYTLYNGQTLQLSVNTTKKVKWSSTKKSVATVNSDGLVTAKKVGTAYIKAKFGNKTLKAKIKVKTPLTISKSKLSLKEGQDKTVTLTYRLGGYLTFFIEDEDVVECYWDEAQWQDNKIELHLVGKNAGSTVVTVTNSITKDKVKLTVTVKASSSDDEPPSEDTPPEDTSKGKYRALLIANSNYRYGQDLPNHKWDAKAVKGLLTQSVTTPYTVTIKNDCSASAILKAIPAAFSGATEQDVSLFFYGGHGLSASGALHGSLCGVDDTFVSPAELRDALLKIPGRVIVILDCCYSGSLISNDGKAAESKPSSFNRAVVNAFTGYNMTDPDVESSGKSGELMTSKFIVLTACTKYEESWNYWYVGYNEDQSHSAFAKALFEGLGCKWSSGIYTGKAPCDKDKDGIATLGECQSYVYTRAAQINRERGHSEQHCMSYGTKTYPLFKLKK